MKIVLSQGDTLNVFIAEADGEFEISYGGKRPDILTIQSDLPDSLGREGFVYAECFNTGLVTDSEEPFKPGLIDETARQRALDLMTDEEILALYNSFESAAQSRGLIG